MSLSQTSLARESDSQTDWIIESLPLADCTVLSSGKQSGEADVNASAEHKH